MRSRQGRKGRGNSFTHLLQKLTKNLPKQRENSAERPVDIRRNALYDYIREKLIWNRRLFFEWTTKMK